ncbi:putative phage protein (TIGR02216 family) [Altererythrobacter atlanticus]|uniref:Uncharacterized protein n=1 Tax=Croceibacterium atlanticum TaxID=1267766 RepID=A0A0F7KWB0_9SPHN|nr:phage tail assembly chaperone [Croceibacterium atlanticum]AKH43482.1 hypothetical protein WYH_02452 [Croceibacterium atlanticum]MBB5731810.1 putative phage protein (TIGR02216 family) [Croceibacterium atlanticum]
MSACFAAAALRLSGLASRQLGWRPDDFWSATPAELMAILAPPEGHRDAPLSRHEMQQLMERERNG